MSSKQISKDRYVQSGLAHVSTGILVGSLLGGAGVICANLSP